jgi:hypothetical protein
VARHSAPSEERVPGQDDKHLAWNASAHSLKIGDAAEDTARVIVHVRRVGPETERFQQVADGLSQPAPGRTMRQ